MNSTYSLPKHCKEEHHNSIKKLRKIFPMATHSTTGNTSTLNQNFLQSIDEVYDQDHTVPQKLAKCIRQSHDLSTIRYKIRTSPPHLRRNPKMKNEHIITSKSGKEYICKIFTHAEATPYLIDALLYFFSDIKNTTSYEAAYIGFGDAPNDGLPTSLQLYEIIKLTSLYNTQIIHTYINQELYYVIKKKFLDKMIDTIPDGMCQQNSLTGNIPQKSVICVDTSKIELPSPNKTLHSYTKIRKKNDCNICYLTNLHCQNFSIKSTLTIINLFIPPEILKSELPPPEPPPETVLSGITTLSTILKQHSQLLSTLLYDGQRYEDNVILHNLPHHMNRINVNGFSLPILRMNGNSNKFPFKFRHMYKQGCRTYCNDSHTVIFVTNFILPTPFHGYIDCTILNNSDVSISKKRIQIHSSLKIAMAVAIFPRKYNPNTLPYTTQEEKYSYEASLRNKYKRIQNPNKNKIIGRDHIKRLELFSHGEQRAPIDFWSSTDVNEVNLFWTNNINPSIVSSSLGTMITTVNNSVSCNVVKSMILSYEWNQLWATFDILRHSIQYYLQSQQQENITAPFCVCSEFWSLDTTKTRPITSSSNFSNDDHHLELLKISSQISTCHKVLRQVLLAFTSQQKKML